MTRRGWRLVLQVLLSVLGGCGRIGFEPRGPVAWWTFDEGMGTTASDASGYGHTAALGPGVTWAAGHLGSAVVLDGTSNQTIDVGPAADLLATETMTLSAWVNARSFHLGNQVDDAIVGRDGSKNGWSLKGSEDCGGTEHFTLQVSGAPGSITERCSALVPATGRWYHVAAVYDRDARTMDVYVDGKLDDGDLYVDDKPAAGDPMDSVPAQRNDPAAIDLQIGDVGPTAGRGAGGSNTFSGLLDDVRIYDRALSADEIAQLARQ